MTHVGLFEVVMLIYPISEQKPSSFHMMTDANTFLAGEMLVLLKMLFLPYKGKKKLLKESKTEKNCFKDIFFY